MIIDTKKSLIVFYYTPEREYKIYGVRYFKDSFIFDYCIPVLYTDNIIIARKTKQKLNNLRA